MTKPKITITVECTPEELAKIAIVLGATTVTLPVVRPSDPMAESGVPDEPAPTDEEEREAIQEVEAKEEERIAEEAEVDPRQAADEAAAERAKEPASKKRQRRKAPPRAKPKAEPEGDGLDALPEAIRDAPKFKDLLKALIAEGYEKADLLAECERLKELGHKAVARIVNLSDRIERTLEVLKAGESAA